MIGKERLEKIRKILSKYPKFEYLGSGRRGTVYRISENLAVKIENDSSEGRIEHEYKMLKKLSKHKYFPKPKSYNKEHRFMIREYVGGKPIKDVKLTPFIIKEVAKMCHMLDEEGIVQGELTRPFNHIFIDGKKIKMIDFEKARASEHPNNLNQIVEFLRRRFKLNSKELIDVMKDYKKNHNKFNDVLLLLSKLNIIH